MSRKFTIAVIGCGNRGLMFASKMQSMTDRFEIAALCEARGDAAEKCKKVLGVADDVLFSDEDEFFKKKRADALVIATYDRDHVRHAVAGMELGYDILLEKPITDSEAELDMLLEVQKKTGSKVLVCHELRYVPSFRLADKWLKDGEIGQLMQIEATERVAYFHFAQAYVRGPFRSSASSHPLVLAKCSHDLDLLRHYVGERCETVCSDGDTSFFIKENKPDFAAERCVDCRYKNECIYSAKKIYIDGWHKAGEPADGWPYSKITQSVPITEESLYEGIGSGMYGTCVFGGDNDTCDRQSVLMRFENGVIATLNIAVAAYPGRRINFFGSKGEILLDERKGTVDLYRFGDDPVSVSIDSIRENKSGHGGGDDNLVDVFYKVLCGEADTETSLEKSIESHRMGIAAEKSRKNGGMPIKVI